MLWTNVAIKGRRVKQQGEGPQLMLLDTIRNFEDHLAKNPDDVTVWVQLSEAFQSHDMNYHDGGTYQPKALNAYNRALALNPNDELKKFIYFKMALLYHIMGRSLDSIDIYDQLLSGFSLTPEEKTAAFYDRGLCLHMLRRNHEARSSLRTALVINPNHLPVYKALIDCTKELAKVSVLYSYYTFVLLLYS